VIRAFQIGDVAAVCDVLNACSASEWAVAILPEAFRKIVLNSGEWGKANAYVGVHNKQVCGFGAVVLDGQCARIPYLHVHPAFRRRGIGDSLLREVETYCDTHGCASLSFGGFALRSPFHGADARDSETVSFLLRRGYVEHSRAATRVLRLPPSSLAEQDAKPRSSTHRFEIASESHSDYWAIRSGVVDLCHHSEPLFAVFANAYEGREVRRENAHIAAAMQGRSLVGLAGLVPFRDAGIGYEAYPLFGPLLVHPAHRGRGIGRTLLKMSLARMSELGCERVVLGGTGVAGPAAHLYESVGFEIVVNWVEYWKQKAETGAKRPEVTAGSRV
jgi:GNAT superfamily N-acetyltransferase